MNEPIDRRKALRQALWLALVLALAIGVVAVLQTRPASRDSVRIAVGTLRSQAAELEYLTGLAGAARLNATFTHAHARQLAQAVDRANDSLARLAVRQALRRAQSTARASGNDVAAGARVVRDAADLRAAAASAGKALPALRRLEDKLR